MKKLLTALAITAGLFATQAFSQSAFNGAFGQVGVGYENTAPGLTSSGLKVNGASSAIGTSSSSQAGFASALSAGYYAALSPKFLLGVGVDYAPFATQSGNFTAAKTNGSYQLQNQYNIFVSPAMNVGTNGLAYGKVGYAGAQSKISNLNSSTNQNYTGYSVGLGYKQIIKGGLYGFGEVNYTSYGNQTSSPSGRVAGQSYSYAMTSNANVTNFLVGVGYKF